MNVSEIMTRDVVTAMAGMTFKDATDAMVAHDVSALPVLDDLGRVIGIVSEADLVRRAATPGKHGPRTVGDVMTTRPVTVGAAEPVANAARLLHAGRLKHLPVVDDVGVLVGVVSRHDVLGVFLRPDAAIADEIDAALADPMRTPEGHRVRASVGDGVVRLTGDVETEDDRRVVAAAVWRVPGVVDVVDEVVAFGPAIRMP